ncbi:hypothetical protein OESDEN_04135 [Oesophagostomum dentatum]|uniref:Uncharacterized protein n=1 Tax=Oesophagostomum dentatum TaxID=61180 RepID=A0A0B1TKG8_OESDE|nr:hypothetical protein OESDEN_04135 [Oesophagostomum dentatum]
MSSSGCLSREEFLVLQEQLIALRNKNYELQEKLQKKNLEIAQLSTPKSDALQFASKLMNRRDKEKELTQKYEGELDALRAKLMTQEEEFRLQQKTLISELNKVVSQNQSMEKELDQIRSCGSLYSSPQAGTPCEPKTFASENCAQEIAGSAIAPECSKDFASSTVSDSQIEKDNRIKTLELSLVEKDAVISALEDKLLEYKEKTSKLEEDLAHHLEAKTAFNAAAMEKDSRLSSLEKELGLLKETIAERDSFITKLQSSLSLICRKVTGEETDCPADYGRSLLEKRMTVLLESISLNDERNSKILAEKLRNKLAALEQSNDKQVEDRVLLLETRYQLELSDREKLFDKEKDEWSRKLHALESSLAAKDEEKVCVLVFGSFVSIIFFLLGSLDLYG